jgi:hypothetical protein
LLRILEAHIVISPFRHLGLIEQYEIPLFMDVVRTNPVYFGGFSKSLALIKSLQDENRKLYEWRNPSDH